VHLPDLKIAKYLNLHWFNHFWRNIEHFLPSSIIESCLDTV